MVVKTYPPTSFDEPTRHGRKIFILHRYRDICRIGIRLPTITPREIHSNSDTHTRTFRIRFFFFTPND